MFFTASFAFYLFVKYFKSPEIVFSQSNQATESKIIKTRENRKRGRSANKRGYKRYQTDRIFGNIKTRAFSH